MCEEQMSRRDFHALCDRFRYSVFNIEINAAPLVKVEFQTLLLMLCRHEQPMAIHQFVPIFNGCASGHFSAFIELRDRMTTK